MQMPNDLNLLRAKRRFHPSGRPISKAQANRLRWQTQTRNNERSPKVFSRLAAALARMFKPRGPRADRRAAPTATPKAAQNLIQGATETFRTAPDMAA